MMGDSSNSTTVHSETDWLEESGFKEMVESIRTEIGRLEGKPPTKKSIYKVPDESSGNVYSPRFISIGPIHACRPDLLAMKEMKLRYTSFFLYRSKDPVGALIDCCKALIELGDVRKCFAPHIKETDSEGNNYQLTKVLVTDGCFVLELFLRLSGQLKYPYLEENGLRETGENDVKDDPILRNDWIRGAVCQDLALIENQIPFMVLESLWSAINKQNSTSIMTLSIKDIVLALFCSYCNLSLSRLESISIPINHIPRKEMHFLDVLHEELRPISRELDNGKRRCGLNYCATELCEAGVGIDKADNYIKIGRKRWGLKLEADIDDQVDIETENFNNHSLEIVFDKVKGVVKIPQIWIGGLTSSIMKNLIALEQCSLITSHHVTSYVMFMRSLISSKEDVVLLKQKGVIKQSPGISDQNVVEFFTACCKDVLIKDFYFSWVCEDAGNYIDSWKHIHKYKTLARSRSRMYVTVVKQRYCPDACRTIAFFAAFVLLVFTALSTFYTVYPYYS